jgi:hypothetical protein
MLASIDLWEIMDITEEASTSNANSKVLKEYQRCVKNSMFSIGLKKLQKAH